MDDATKNLVIKRIQDGHVIALRSDRVPEAVEAVQSAGLDCHVKPAGGGFTHQQITPGLPRSEPEIPPFSWQITSGADREDESAAMQDLTKKLKEADHGERQ